MDRVLNENPGAIYPHPHACRKRAASKYPRIYVLPSLVLEGEERNGYTYNLQIYMLLRYV